MQDASMFRIGDRVRLVSMNDPYRPDAPIGAEGTVLGVAPPPVNVLNVEWDCGFPLNPCLDVDAVERIGAPVPDMAGDAERAMPTYVLGTYDEGGEELATVFACRTALDADAAKATVKRVATMYCRELARKGWTGPHYDFQIGDVCEMLEDKRFCDMLAEAGIDVRDVEPYRLELHDYDEVYVDMDEVFGKQA